MNVQKLPLEIFRMIIGHYLEEVAIYRAVEQRAVSSKSWTISPYSFSDIASETFCFEIERAILALNPAQLSSCFRLNTMGLDSKKCWFQTRLTMVPRSTYKLDLLIQHVLRILDHGFGGYDVHIYNTNYRKALFEACIDSLNIQNLISVTTPLSEAEAEAFLSRLTNEALELNTHLLVAAAAIGNISAVMALLGKGTNPENFSTFLGNASNAATRSGHLDILKLLLSAGCELQRGVNLDDQDYMITNRFTRSIFYTASMFGNLDACRLLQEAFSSRLSIWTWKYQWQSSALTAIQFGHLHVVDWILTHDHARACIAKYEPERNKQHVIEYACQFGREDIVRHLINRYDFDVTYIGRERRSARGLLSYAAQGGNPKVVELLLHHGAPVIVPNCHGLSNALVRATNNNHVEAAAILIREGAPINSSPGTPLNLAIDKRQFAAARLLLDSGADIYRENDRFFGDVWCRWGSEDEITFLLEAGFDLSRYTDRRTSPLYLALSTGHFRVARILLKYGAKPIKPPGSRKKDRWNATTIKLHPHTGCCCDNRKIGHIWNYCPSHRQLPEPNSWGKFGMIPPVGRFDT